MQVGCLQPATKEAEQTLCSGVGKLCDWTDHKADHERMYAITDEIHEPENK